MRVTKTYKNCMISSKQGSDYWDVFQDGRFYATVFNEEEARSVIYKLIGENEYITDEMMTKVKYD